MRSAAYIGHKMQSHMFFPCCDSKWSKRWTLIPTRSPISLSDAARRLSALSDLNFTLRINSQTMRHMSYAVFTRDTFTWGKCIFEHFTIENVTQYNRNVNLRQVNTAVIMWRDKPKFNWLLINSRNLIRKFKERRGKRKKQHSKKKEKTTRREKERTTQHWK